MLILSADDVRAALDMPSCIEAMRGALLGLHRGELSMPLRSLVRPPGSALLGLMPAHRGGARPLFSLKEIVFAPANSARGLDTHQGAVLLHDGVDGRLIAVVNASAITEIRTAAGPGPPSTLPPSRNARRGGLLCSGAWGASPAGAL